MRTLFKYSRNQSRGHPQKASFCPIFQLLILRNAIPDLCSWAHRLSWIVPLSSNGNIKMI